MTCSRYVFIYTRDERDMYKPFNYLCIKSEHDDGKHTRAIRCSGLDFNKKAGFVFLMNKFIEELEKEGEDLDSLIKVSYNGGA